MILKNRSRLFTDVVVFLFIFLFVYAASSKLSEYEKFKIQIGQSPLIEKFSSVLVWFVPGLEFAIVLLLLIHRTRLLGLYLSTSVMILFSGYIAYVINVSSYVPCSCGGILERLGWSEHLVFNLGFVLLGILTLLVIEQATNYQTQQRNSIAIGQEMPKT